MKYLDVIIKIILLPFFALSVGIFGALVGLWFGVDDIVSSFQQEKG